MILNEKFREALEETIQRHQEVMLFLDRQSFHEGDDSNEANYCKAIGVILADNMGQMQMLNQHFYSLPDHAKEALVSQCTWRINSSKFLVEANQSLGKRIESLVTEVEHVSFCMNRAVQLFKQNPEDFEKMDRAEQFLNSLKITKTGPNN